MTHFKIDIHAMNSHETWLRENLPRLSVSSWVHKRYENSTITMELRASAEYGPRSTIEEHKRWPKLRFRHYGSQGIFARLKWIYLEKWILETEQRRRKSTNAFEFSDLTIKILNDNDEEYLSIHWEATDDPSRKYQPHWHFHIITDEYYLSNLHVPLNHSWGHWMVDGINNYHIWIDGLLDFIEGEFPRCLVKKKILPPQFHDK